MPQPRSGPVSSSSTAGRMIGPVRFPTAGRNTRAAPAPTHSLHGGCAADRRLRWRRLLDGDGQHAARRLRAGPRGRRAAAGLLPARPRAATRTTTSCASTGRSTRRAASRRTSRCSAATAARPTSTSTSSRATSSTSAAAASSAMLGAWRAHGLDHDPSARLGAAARSCVEPALDPSAGSAAPSAPSTGPADSWKAWGCCRTATACTSTASASARARSARHLLDGMCAGYAAEDGAALHFTGERLATRRHLAPEGARVPDAAHRLRADRAARAPARYWATALAIDAPAPVVRIAA